MSGPGPGSGGPFYFHYVTDSTVAFSSACYTEDEQIFAFELKHDEGQIPVLELEIKNPEVGLLSSGRLTWAWFSWYNGSTVVPLFFGRLVGIPSDLFAQVIKVQFVARAPDYIARKQAVAETLKIAPYYDPVFLDDSHRDDPDAILEGWSAFYHIDRTSLAWTVSDILSGEDGTVTFDGDHAFYDSLEFHIGQPPFIAIKVDITAKWAQQSTGGSVNLGPWSFVTYTGASMIADWPKPGADIGGGWSVQASYALDLNGIELAPSGSYSYQWQNQDTQHAEGDTMSLSVNYSYPVYADTGTVKILISEQLTSGVQRSSINQQFVWIPQYNINAYLYLQYKADRKRTEKLSFILQSDLQPVLTDPTVEQDSEVIVLNTATLSDPLLLPKNWTVLAGQAVAVGQICKPNNPILPGGTSFQICVIAGTCGSTQPTFSDVIGATTTDNSVTWACLGESLPAVSDWRPATAASLGTIIAPSTPVWIYYSALLPPVIPYRTSGAQVSEGTVIRTDDNVSYQVCTIGGTTSYAATTGYLTSSWPPAFSPVWGVTTNDGSVQWTSLGPTLPYGSFQLCVQAGVTALQLPPAWSAVAGNTVTDNTVHWLSLGGGGPSISIPAGGQVGNVTTRSYFPTDRGLQSLEYALMKARAHLRKRARCVEIGWAASFAMGVGLSCRMNATIQDPRLPGATATGKIISYVLSCDGDSGEALTKVRIGCAVGNGGTAVAAAPTDFYIADGYFADGYFETVGATTLPASSDVTYAPPPDNPNDDDLVFPLTADQVVLTNQIYGDATTQQAALTALAPALQHETQLQQQEQNATAQWTMIFAQQLASLSSQTVDNVLAEVANAYYLDLELKPVTGSAFTTVYSVGTTLLQIPKQIDLAA